MRLRLGGALSRWGDARVGRLMRDRRVDPGFGDARRRLGGFTVEATGHECTQEHSRG
jgi:hypothetical protein